MANVSLTGAENNCVMQTVACDCEAYTVCTKQQHTQKGQTAHNLDGDLPLILLSKHCGVISC